MVTALLTRGFSFIGSYYEMKGLVDSLQKKFTRIHRCGSLLIFSVCVAIITT